MKAATSPDATDLAVLRAMKARASAASYRRAHPKRNPPAPTAQDIAIAEVVNDAALRTEPWAPNAGKAFISDVYDTIVADGRDGGMPLEEFKGELVRLHKLGLVTLTRADLVAAMPHGKVARSEADAGGATFHFVHFIVQAKRNPYMGSHPDLFGPSMFDQYPHRPGPQKVDGSGFVIGDDLVRPADPAARRAKKAAGPESPTFVPLSDLTSEQIRELKRHQFTDQEWAELDDDDREYIEENDEESQARVDKLAALFIDRWKWERSGDRDNFERVEESFEHVLMEKARAATLYEFMPKRPHDRLVRLGEQSGFTDADVDAFLGEFFENTNNYSFVTERTRGTVAYEENIEGYVFIEDSEWEEEAEGMTKDEIQRAIDKISDDTDADIDLTMKDLDRSYIEVHFDTGITVYATFDADDAAQHVENRIEEEFGDRDEKAQFEDPADAPPAEERVIYRWKDGFYVLDLLPSELPEEGKAMGMCVGRPDMGYGRAVANGEIKILSVRRPSGKPLFTIEAQLNEFKETRPILELVQVKGKANRLPGFDLGKTAPGTPLKKDEVVRIYELVEGPGGLGEKYGLKQAVDDVQDLKPAAREVNMLFRNGDKWATDLLTRLGIEEPRAVYWPGAEPGPRQNPGPACGRHGEGCTGFCAPYKRRSAPMPRMISNPAPFYIHYSSRPEEPQVPERTINQFAGGSGPLGVYTYLGDGTVPHTFAANRPYKFRLIPTVPVLETSKYTQADLERDLARLAELEDIRRPLRLFDKYADEIGADNPGYPPFAKLWYVISRIPTKWQIEENELPSGLSGGGFANPKRGRELFVELGYPVIEDRRGIIYSSEPQQAVFLTDDSFVAEPF